MPYERTFDPTGPAVFRYVVDTLIQGSMFLLCQTLSTNHTIDKCIELHSAVLEQDKAESPEEDIEHLAGGLYGLWLLDATSVRNTALWILWN